MEIVEVGDESRVLDSRPPWRNDMLEELHEGEPTPMGENETLLLELAKRMFVDTKPILLLDIVGKMHEKYGHKKVSVSRALKVAWTNGLVRRFYEPRLKRQAVDAKNRHATYYLLHNLTGFKPPEPVQRVKDHRVGRQFAHLTPSDVRFIRAAQGKISYRELAAKFDVSDTIIYRIWNRQLWKNVD